MGLISPTGFWNDQHAGEGIAKIASSLYVQLKVLTAPQDWHVSSTAQAWEQSGTEFTQSALTRGSSTSWGWAVSV